MDKAVSGSSVDFVSADAFRTMRDGQRTTSLLAYSSAGRLLILDRFREVGDEQRAPRLLEAMGGQLETTVLLDGVASDAAGVAADPSLSTEKINVVPGSLSTLTGYLGNFQAIVSVGERAINLGETLAKGNPCYDLVLDLQTPAVFQQDVLPVGYFAPGDDPQALQEALEQIPEMIGEFERPVFVEYNPDICAHGSSGIHGCTRCLDACPTLAITSLGEKIELDAYLCQGGGVCATACPSGALTYVYPAVEDLLESLKEPLKKRPVALIHDKERGKEEVTESGINQDGTVLAIETEEVASLGIEAWMAMLAIGARRIDILITDDVPQGVLSELKAQLVVAKEILSGMQLPPESIRLVGAGSDNTLVAVTAAEPQMPAFDMAGFALFSDKRTNLRLAVDHLHQHLPADPERVSLPANSPFGQINVDNQSCTLCMACVSVCPARALNDGGESPQLKFVESKCVQCGICANACPENAIELVPGYLYDSIEARKAKVLHEEEPFCCVNCGVPFATRKMIDRMGEKLSQHWMFKDDDALRRLQMCEDCRVKDIFLKNEQGIDVHRGSKNDA